MRGDSARLGRPTIQVAPDGERSGDYDVAFESISAMASSTHSVCIS